MITPTAPQIYEENIDVKRSPAIRLLAQVISYLFHPLFISVYVACFVLFVHPLLFAGYDGQRKIRLAATIFVNLTLLPGITVFLCWRLKFIKNMYLDSQRDRIIPLAAAMIFYFWCWYVLKNFNEIPELFRQFLLGSFITIIVAWLANISFKISLHALAMGGMLGFIFILVYNAEGSSAWYLAVALVLAGVVSSARLIAGTHRPFDIYAGLVLGVLSQLAALVV